MRERLILGHLDIRMAIVAYGGPVKIERGFALRGIARLSNYTISRLSPRDGLWARDSWTDAMYYAVTGAIHARLMQCHLVQGWNVKLERKDQRSRSVNEYVG